ncbi:MAG: type II toxin-antitoxin system VapC family toxin [Candidatus Methylacidiphilales bacterium]|nr:type II toxin-antitoxin system VapC family toxin [Candidatus Methylacidiphilales bacterium]
MSHLVDTNGWIGFLDGRDDFGARAKQVMLGSSQSCFISIASIWEAAIKVGLGKLKLPYDLKSDLPRILEENGFVVVGIDIEDATAVRQLEPLHGDPFDRIQVVQARRRGWDVISRDPVFDRYGLSRVW